MRGAYHVLRLKLRIFWGVISMLAHLAWTRWHPEQAAAMLCVKRLEGTLR